MYTALTLILGVGLSSQPVTPNSLGLQTFVRFAEGAQAGQSDARSVVELVVLRGGAPVEGVKMVVDGAPLGETDDDGGLIAEMRSGRVKFVLEEGGADVLELDLLTAKGEIVQMIVSLKNDGSRPDLLIENSGRSSILAGEGEREEDVATEAGDEQPPGALVGAVTSAEDQQVVAGARVFFSGVEVKTETDDEGRFAVELPAGTYSVSVIHPNFASQTIDGIRVIPGKEVTANLELTPAGVRLQDYVVTAPYVEGSIASQIEAQREASTVSDVLGAEQISATGDSNAAEALGRVTGLTVEQGKFVLVRGQAYRFTLALFNGSPLPSPEPLVQAVPLDLFPTGVLKGIEVVKSYTPDLPGAFGAGLVDLQTRGIADEGFAEISVSAGYNSETTFLDGLTYQGGGLDFLGFDDGTRDIPEAIVDLSNNGRQEIRPRGGGLTEEEIFAAAQGFPTNLNFNEQPLPPDFGLGITGGNSWDLPNDGVFGFIGTANYDNEWRRQRRIQRGFALRSNDELVAIDDTREFRTDNNVTLSGLLTLTAEWDKHSLSTNTFLVNDALNRSQFTTGVERGSNDDAEIRRSLLQWIERSLIAQQLVGEHDLGPVIVNYGGIYAVANRDSPDQRDFFYQRRIGAETFVIQDPTGLNRTYSEIQDTQISLNLDVSFPPTYLSEDFPIKPTPKIGIAYADTQRDARQQLYRLAPNGPGSAVGRRRQDPNEVFDPDNLGSGLEFQDLSIFGNDDYNGSATVLGVYGMLDLSLWDTVRLVGGARFEDADYELEAFQGIPGGDDSVFSGFNEEDVLPAVNATWFVSDQVQLRAAYGKSLSRPVLNELAPALFLDPDTGQQFQGNPTLVPTKIDGYETRLEWYPTTTESLSIGLFVKEYTDALERTFVGTGGDGTRATFQNADEAIVYGFELGGRFEFGHFIDWFDAPDFMDKLYVIANLSVLFSEVQLAEAGVATDLNRPLDGQADFVFNGQIGYDGEEHDVTLSYQQIGTRLRRAGILGQPNIFQDPVPDLDLTWTWRFTEDWTFKLKGSNLMNPTARLVQQRETFRSFERGASISTSIAWEFL